MSRLYVVTSATGKRLIQADTPAQAIRHAAGTEYKAKVATQMDIVGLITGDTKVEIAGEEASHVQS